MSMVKLLIYRSPCIAIPPSLISTSFIESPVLLSNVKVSFFFFDPISSFYLLNLMSEVKFRTGSEFLGI